MSHTHCLAELTMLVRLAFELTVEYDVYIWGRLDAFSVDELTSFQFVEIGVFHEELESLEGDLRENWMAQSQVFQG